MHCKENGRSSFPEKDDQYNFDPVNQHMGPYQPAENNGVANSIYALFGSKDLNDIQANERLARDAYVMSTIRDTDTINNQGIILTGDDAYDLGIARFEVPSNDEIVQHLNDKPLRLPLP